MSCSTRSKPVPTNAPSRKRRRTTSTSPCRSTSPSRPTRCSRVFFYLNLLNDKACGPGDQPFIGIILCAEKDDVEVEYALRTKANPIGVAAYAMQSRLPRELKGKLPTAQQLTGIVRAEMGGGK